MTIRKRMVRIFRAVTGRALSEVEADNAEAMLELESENLREQVARYNQGLAMHAGQCERLRRRIAELERESKEAERRTRSLLASGDRARAGESALREERLVAERASEGEALEEAERAYRELVHARRVAVQAAREKIEGLRRTIGHTRMQTALADLTELAANLHGTVGLCDAEVDRLREKMEERRDLATGRVRVAREMLDPEAVRPDEEERAAMEAAALARFEERLRAESGAAPAPGSAASETGPGESPGAAGSVGSAGSS